MERNGDSAWTNSKQDFLESGERRSVPNMLVVVVFGLGSPRRVGQSGYLGESVEVEDGDEVLDVEEDHHVGKGQEHRSIRAIDGPRP